MVAQLSDFRRLISAGEPARVLVQEVKEVKSLPQEHYHFPLYSQYQSSKWSLHGGRPESRREIELEAEPERLDEDPIVKAPLEPVPTDEPQDTPAGSSSDPPSEEHLPGGPFPPRRLSYVLVWGYLV